MFASGALDSDDDDDDDEHMKTVCFTLHACACTAHGLCFLRLLEIESQLLPLFFCLIFIRQAYAICII